MITLELYCWLVGVKSSKYSKILYLFFKENDFTHARVNVFIKDVQRITKVKEKE